MKSFGKRKNAYQQKEPQESDSFRLFVSSQDNRKVCLFS